MINKTTHIPANELTKMFYALEKLGYAPVTRIHFELRGAMVDIDRLRRAYRLAVKRFPIFNARLHDRSSLFFWKLCWVLNEKIDSQSAVCAWDLTCFSPQEAEELFEKIQFEPFRSYRSSYDPPFWMALCKFSKDQYKLLAFFNHALTDGHGYQIFLKTLFETYNWLAKGGRTETILTPDLISGPESLLSTTRLGRVKGFFQACALLVEKAFLKKGSVPAQLIGSQGSLSARTGAVQRTFEAATLRRYLAAAKQLGVSLTHLFTAAQAIALERWKKERHESCNVISVQVLTSLRKTETSRREIQNSFSGFSLVLPKACNGDPAGLAAWISQQSRLCIENNEPEKTTGLLCLLNFTLVKKLLPLWGNAVFNNPGLGDSFQVSNTGRLWAGPDGIPLITHLGNADIIASFLAVGPPIPSMGPYTGLCTFREKLHMSFNYFAWSLPKQDAHDFVDLMQQVLEELTDLTGKEAGRSVDQMRGAA